MIILMSLQASTPWASQCLEGVDLSLTPSEQHWFFQHSREEFAERIPIVNSLNHGPGQLIAAECVVQRIEFDKSRVIGRQTIYGFLEVHIMSALMGVRGARTSRLQFGDRARYRFSA